MRFRNQDLSPKSIFFRKSYNSQYTHPKSTIKHQKLISNLFQGKAKYERSGNSNKAGSEKSSATLSQNARRPKSFAAAIERVENSGRKFFGCSRASLGVRSFNLRHGLGYTRRDFFREWLLCIAGHNCHELSRC